MQEDYNKLVNTTDWYTIKLQPVFLKVANQYLYIKDVSPIQTNALNLYNGFLISNYSICVIDMQVFWYKTDWILPQILLTICFLALWLWRVEKRLKMKKYLLILNKRNNPEKKNKKFQVDITCFQSILIIYISCNQTGFIG